MNEIMSLRGPENVFVWSAVLSTALVATVATARLRWLTPAGGATALAVGAAVLLGTGLGGVTLLLLFFLSSSTLTTVSRRMRHRGPRHSSGDGEPADVHADDRRGTTDRERTARQVLANGGIAAIAAVSGLVGWLPDSAYAVTGSLAAATADTWATELGTLIGSPTRLVTTWRAVPPGRSGGVSWPGSAAAGAGATLIGGTAALLFGSAEGWSWLAVGAASGVTGTIADSFAGAGIEARFRWVDNDVVNGICTVTGGAAGWILGRILIG